MVSPATDQKIIHDLDPQKEKSQFTSSSFLFFFASVVIVGLLVGFLVSSVTKSNKSGNKDSSATTQKSEGIADKKTFKDKAEGILEEGGLEGEGNFHLERPGGESQNVYLTSTTVDLSQYIGKRVRVWGETFTAEKAGWLMDVGLVELLQ